MNFGKTEMIPIGFAILFIVFICLAMGVLGFSIAVLSLMVFAKDKLQNRKRFTHIVFLIASVLVSAGATVFTGLCGSVLDLDSNIVFVLLWMVPALSAFAFTLILYVQISR